ncbi:Tf2-9, partial [Mucuna pruriens]
MAKTEVVHRVLEQYLRVFVHHQPNQYGRFLSLAKWSYNTTTHSATSLSSFQVTYGKPPSNIPSSLWEPRSLKQLTLFSNMIEFLKKKHRKAQQSMKKSVNAHRRDVTYSVRDWIYVCIRPYRQTSVSGVHYNKLVKIYCGLYQIKEVLGPVAYRLDLPESAKIHPVFHCSLLKPHHGPVHSQKWKGNNRATLFSGSAVVNPPRKIGTSCRLHITLRTIMSNWQGLIVENEDTMLTEDVRPKRMTRGPHG